METRRPTLKHDLRKDVLVVGGGIAGISSAIHLKRVGYDVVLIEKNEIGGPATGASSGVLYYGSGTNLNQAIGLFGEETANMLWKETSRAIEGIVYTARQSEIECGLRTCGSVMVAKTEEEVRELDAEHSAVKRLSLPARQMSSSDVKECYPLRQFAGGLAFEGVAQIHPAQFASGVARREGVEIYEGTSMVAWRQDGEEIEVKTEAGMVRCAELVIATNKEPCFGLEIGFGAESSVILASKPTGRVREAFPEEKIFWTMEDRYDMMYPRGDRLMLELYALGEESQKLSYYFPGLDFVVDKWWGETWAKTSDYVPIVGKVSDHVTVATGMGDQGVVMGWLSGSKVPMIIQGKEDWYTRAASPSRIRPLGTMSVGEMMVKPKPQGPSVMRYVEVGKASEIHQGKMKIFNVGGVELVVANVDGAFYALPNICTHAGGPLGKGKLKGSVVQCPFHGSKFDFRTGAAVGPPATVGEPMLQMKIENNSIWVQVPGA